MFLRKLLFLTIVFSSCSSFVSAQDFILRPSPGREIILAVADMEPAAEERWTKNSDALQTFNQVLWNDLSFSGFFTLAGKSFYPSQSIGAQAEETIPFDAWAALPFR